MKDNQEGVIYQDDRIRIAQTEFSPDEHDVTIDGVDGAYCLLQRGVLKDLASRTNIQDIRASLYAMNYNFCYQLEQLTVKGRPISLETIAWAFAKARMHELENEVEYFCDEVIKLKEDA